MNWSTRLTFLFALTAGSVLAACNLPNNPAPNPDAVACSPAELVAPVLAAPAEGDVVAISFTFTLTYPIYCDPDRVVVEVCTGPTCAYAAVSGEIVGPGSSWTPDVPLENAMHYFWRAAAVSLVDGDAAYGPWSAPVSFFTGPLCDASSPLPPILMYPVEGAFVDPTHSLTTLPPLFQWSRRVDCLPPAYRIEISLDPAFGGEMISHTTKDSATYWRLDRDLEPESTYYWRVAETDGVSLGPWSPVHSFQTNPIPVDGLAVIAGTVWHDRCYIDWEGGGPPATGCVAGDPYPVGDGVRTADEPGIPGVMLSYVSGICTTGWDMGRSHNVASSTTADGEYYQWLAPGTYCFTILRSEGDNHNIFNGGYWTAPQRGGTFNIFPMAQITVAAGEARTDVDFGYDFLFGSSVTPAGISGQVWNDLNADGFSSPLEPGLWDVEAWLSLGVCSSSYRSSPHLTTVTAPDGTYAFGYLNPGSYCLAVDPDEPPNFDVLYAGEWTAPGSGSGVQLVDVTLSEGQLLADSDFGYHYFGSGYPTATPIFAEPTRVQATLQSSLPTQQFTQPTLQLAQPTLQLAQPTLQWQAMPTATPIPWQVMPTPNTTPYQ